MNRLKAFDENSVLNDVALVAAYWLINAIISEKQPKVMDAGAGRQPNGAEFGRSSSRQEPLDTQQWRSTERGRGRRAPHPGHMPWLGWKDVLWRTYGQVQEDRLLAISAGVVFYGLLALFPAITALVSIYGLFANAATIQEHLTFLSGILPAEAVGIIDEQVQRVIANGDLRLSIGFVAGLGVALWSANTGMKALLDALNIAYEEEEKRGFFELNLVSLTFTVGAIAAMLVALGAVVVLPLVLKWLWLGEFVTDIEFVRWPALSLGLLVALALLYRYGPSRERPRWKWVSVGSLLATVLWIGGSLALSYYLRNHAHYDATYGSLGAAIGLMMWMWLTTIVILFGAELNSELEHQTALDSTDGPAKPLGHRGATMADTVGAAQR